MRVSSKSKTEEWRVIKGYEGYYEVSNLGRIRSLSRVIANHGVNKNFITKERILRLGYLGVGYPSVLLSVDGVRHNKVVHRIVAIAFLENPNNYPMINHKDGDKANNNLENLEWCNAKQNAEHARKTGLIPWGERHTQSKLSNLEQLAIFHQKGKRKAKRLARLFGVSQGLIYLIWRGEGRINKLLDKENACFL